MTKNQTLEPQLMSFTRYGRQLQPTNLTGIFSQRKISEAYNEKICCACPEYSAPHSSETRSLLANSFSFLFDRMKTYSAEQNLLYDLLHSCTWVEPQITGTLRTSSSDKFNY